MKKTLPLGVDDFKKLRENDFYYIDKTLFIKELLDKRSQVSHFTRPRRFGKTLELSMLKYFLNQHMLRTDAVTIIVPCLKG